MNTPLPSNKISALRAFKNITEKLLRSLEVLGEDVDQHVFVSLILTKLPENVLRQLEFNKGSKIELSLGNLRQQLKDYIVACERAGKRNSDHLPTNKSSFASTSTLQRQTVNYHSGSTNIFQRPYRPVPCYCFNPGLLTT